MERYMPSSLAREKANELIALHQCSGTIVDYARSFLKLKCSTLVWVLLDTIFPKFEEGLNGEVQSLLECLGHHMDLDIIISLAYECKRLAIVYCEAREIDKVGETPSTGRNY
ncbi:hypothetical protein SAY87_020131 [Trapa incisa]|uniref:Uncharacterized protein n=1 Tax=Trapa incisa TaxID=236973 RepID=A0AAN7K971_9MYRT|nr:hypothetical protein SAY87_020131 [Trapa incisa]